MLTLKKVWILTNILKSQIALIEGVIPLDKYNNTKLDEYDKVLGCVIVFSFSVVSLNFPFRTPEQTKELFIQGIKHMKGLDPSVNVKMILVMN